MKYYLNEIYIRIGDGLMSVMPHPNKENPERYRVQDKVLGVQKYFSIAKYGEKALSMAEEYQQQLNEKRKYREIRLNLGINKLFDSNGSVRGLSRRTRKRKGRADYDCLAIQVTVEKNVQKGTEIVLNGKKFEDAYRQAQDALLKLHNLERTPEITKMFQQTKRLYW